MAPYSELTTLKKLYKRDGLLSDVAYRALRDAITRGMLDEGERLADRRIAESLELSRTPVREALQRLESEGFIRNVPRIGLVVAEVTPQDIEDIYVIRIALEGVAARLAAQHASTADIALLKQINEQIAVATRKHDLQGLQSLNKQFHEAIYEAARNPRLATLLNTMHDMVQRLRRSTLSVPQRADEALKEHEMIIEAIQARDPERAEALAREHKEKAKLVRMALYHRQAVAR